MQLINGAYNTKSGRIRDSKSKTASATIVLGIRCHAFNTNSVAKF